MKNKSLITLIIAAIAILLLYFLSQSCDRIETEEELPIEEEDTSVVEPEVQPEEPDPEEEVNRSGSGRTEVPASPIVGHVVKVSRCGDGLCDNEESCEDCRKDCGCEEPYSCQQGECAAPECITDEDCDDGNECTTEFCYYAGHHNAYCYNHERWLCGDLVYYTGGGDGPSGDGGGDDGGNSQPSSPSPQYE